MPVGYLELAGHACPAAIIDDFDSVTYTEILTGIDFLNHGNAVASIQFDYNVEPRF